LLLLSVTLTLIVIPLTELQDILPSIFNQLGILLSSIILIMNLCRVSDLCKVHFIFSWDCVTCELQLFSASYLF